MNIDSYATFFVSSILVSLGLLSIMSVIILINNLLSRFWKPVTMFIMEPWHARFTEHSVDKTSEPTLKDDNHGKTN